MPQAFQSEQSAPVVQADVWNDTIMVEDDLARDTEAFHAELFSLIGEVGNWVVYFKGRRLATFGTYEDALESGFEVAGDSPFLVEPIPHSLLAVYLVRFGFSICDGSDFE